MKRTALHSAIVAALAGYYGGGTHVAWSQEGGLEEIIVTAEFREANVQDTPIAITAVNAAMLDARSQTNLAQITAQTPNVSLRPAGSSSGSALVAFIRGIGQTDFNPSVEPGVGIYVDDVYYSTITGNILDLLDLDRVEVLRGPQGTLAGRNAIGGAIKLFTRKPDGSDDINVSLTKGTFNRTELKGAAGLTLVEDKLYMRVAGIAKAMDGYVNRLDYACANPLPRPGTPGGLPTYAQSSVASSAPRAANPTQRADRLALGSQRQILGRHRGQHRQRRFGIAAGRAHRLQGSLRVELPVALAERAGHAAVRFTEPEQPDVQSDCRRHGADLFRQQRQRNLSRRESTLPTTTASSPAARITTTPRTSTTA